MPSRTSGSGVVPLLASLPNLRDLGGHRTQDGRAVRRNRFLRSPRPAGLSDADKDWLCQMDIALFIDFRGLEERAAAPVDLPGKLLSRCLSLPIEPGSLPLLRAVEASGAVSESDIRDIMSETYSNYVLRYHDVYAAFLRALAHQEGTVIFHCSAGKDRTGFAAALLLSVLGVSDAAIAADYLRTNTDWQPSLDPQTPKAYRNALHQAHMAYLKAAFVQLDRHYGGAGAFAAEAFGGVRQRDAFRARETCFARNRDGSGPMGGISNDES